ncbi:carboxylesterase 1E-like [Paramacrobiotus metropolitanus]|uniref:carboxylesterase 1E-like n=1 Tax=Paramacrobiotus metropolitanus TaxID=2943436 RepID=UPI002445818F|nr:carboxylesterase 1E-like [Paramacrobiotus metropolitanus]
MQIFCQFTFLLAVIKVTPSYSQNQEGRVNLSPGVQISGDRFTSAKQRGRVGYVYYGIRYGTARRFENSVENQDFSYLRNNSRVKAGPVCPQRTVPSIETGITAVNQIQDEDCLYLDVYVPPMKSNTSPTSALPVMVWIYGGGFQIGDKDVYNSTALADDIEAIVVTINYRVSIFGFFSTGDSIARGNYGIGDIKLALQWVKKNIGKFGGDPQKIAIFGESAGAVATSILLLDQTVRNSVRAVLSLSGSVLMDLVYTRDPKRETEELASKAGCPVASSSQLVACLKRIPTQTLLAAAKGFAEPPAKNLCPYGIVKDGVHLKDAPLRALEAVARTSGGGPNHVTGYLREDYSLLLSITNPEFLDPRTPLTLNVIRDLVANQFILNQGGPKCAEPNYALAQDIMNYYNFSATDSRAVTLNKLFHLTTDSVFAYPAAKESLLYANAARTRPTGSPSNQLYMISYNPNFNGLGAYHGFDLPNVFFPALQTPGLPMNPRLITSMRQLLRQIAYNGRMNAPDFGQNGQYMELGQSAQWQPGTYNHFPMIQFWDAVSKTPCSMSMTNAQQA